MALQRYVKKKLIASVASGLGREELNVGQKERPRGAAAGQQRFAGAVVVRDAEAREMP